MITRKLEKLFVEYIAAEYVADGRIRSKADASMSEVGFQSGAYAGQSIRILAGETDEEQTLPKIVVSAEDGAEDFDTGNHAIDLTIAVTYPVDNTNAVADQLARLEVEADRLRDWLVSDDLADSVNAHATGDLDVYVFGVADRQSRSQYDEHARTQEIILRVYAGEGITA
jgi:hypothetical protein